MDSTTTQMNEASTSVPTSSRASVSPQNERVEIQADISEFLDLEADVDWDEEEDGEEEDDDLGM